MVATDIILAYASRNKVLCTKVIMTLLTAKSERYVLVIPSSMKQHKAVLLQQKPLFISDFDKRCKWLLFLKSCFASPGQSNY